MFTVTISGTNLVWDNMKTYGNRFNFYYPIDVGHYVIANWAIQKCTLPATNLDFYDDTSYWFHKLSDDTETCLDYSLSETQFY